MSCKNCKASPATDSKVILWRINSKGIVGEWICQECLDCMEMFLGQPHYVHSKNCPSYCDYACNHEEGFDMAEQIRTYLHKNL